MSKFDDRVTRLIDDRVNDIERLFLPGNQDWSGGADMKDCCEKVLQNIRELRSEADKTLKEVEKLKDSNIKPEEISEIIRESSNHTEEDPIIPEMDETGVPKTLKDFLTIIGGILGGAFEVMDWPRFMRWLYKILPYLLLSGKAFIPLLTLVTGIWRGIQDAINDAASRVDRKAILADLDNLRQRLDDMSDLLHEIATGMQPGTEVSVLLDILRRIQDQMGAYAADIDEHLQHIDDAIAEMSSDVHGDFNLLRSDCIMLRSDIACISQWIKGSRNCEDFTVDTFTLIEGLLDTTNQIRCNLDEYYASMSAAMAECCTSMTEELEKVKRKTGEIFHELTKPGNRLETIDGAIERGNVVGTGSLVLTFHNDLNYIKSQLHEIRRLL